MPSAVFFAALIQPAQMSAPSRQIQSASRDSVLCLLICLQQPHRKKRLRPGITLHLFRRQARDAGLDPLFDFLFGGHHRISIQHRCCRFYHFLYLAHNFPSQFSQQVFCFFCLFAIVRHNLLQVCFLCLCILIQPVKCVDEVFFLSECLHRQDIALVRSK